jgi:hypothetical protein
VRHVTRPSQPILQGWEPERQTVEKRRADFSRLDEAFAAPKRKRVRSAG